MPAAPPVSMLLIAYEQEATIGAAVRGALAQTYSPLEILISDDASTDGTWAEIERAARDHRGPHRLVLQRNAVNLGIGAHLDSLVARSNGELLVVAAGDDVSLPHRCARLVDAWLAAGRRPDLIASRLLDIDAEDREGGEIVPTDLAAYRDARDWIARPPHVVGAAQAWTRRVYDRFGRLPAGSVAEDRLMVFRAILAGGAITLAEPLVRYRRGGISQRRRALSADVVARRLVANSRHALVEVPQLLADAAAAGQLAAVEGPLRRELAREAFVRDVFAARGLAGRLRAFRGAAGVPPGWRLRVLVYAACPALTAPFFAIKRWAARRRADAAPRG